MPLSRDEYLLVVRSQLEYAKTQFMLTGDIVRYEQSKKSVRALLKEHGYSRIEIAMMMRNYQASYDLLVTLLAGIRHYIKEGMGAISCSLCL